MKSRICLRLCGVFICQKTGILKLVVGEYADGYGFPLPNPVSIHREYLRPRLEIEWCMQKLQKNEDTWCTILGYFDTEFDSTSRSQLLREVVVWMVLCMILRSPNGNRYVLYLYRNDGQWNWNYNWLDNDWDASEPSASRATLFISPFTHEGSFVWSVDHSIHPASDQSHRV